MELYAKGHNGQVTIREGVIVIERKRLGRFGHSKGDRRIPVNQVTAIQMRPAGPIVNGFIRFTVPGSPDLKGGLSNAASDENAVIFTRKHQTEFDAIRDYVEQAISSVGTQSTPNADPMSQLEGLARLKDQGVISPEEFAQKKAQLLGQI